LDDQKKRASGFKSGTMTQALSTFVIWMLILGMISGAVAIVVTRPSRLANHPGPFMRWGLVLVWAARGLALPLAIWCLMAAGWEGWLPAFLPEVQQAQAKAAAQGGTWLRAWVRACAGGGFVVVSYWGALTAGWALWRVRELIEPEERETIRSLAWTCGLGAAVPSLGLLWLGGVKFAGIAALLPLGALCAVWPRVLTPAPRQPTYTKALVRIKFGKYAEAEWAILAELEKHQDDFDGWLMLAELYATRFDDLLEAEQTILEIVDHPATTPSQLGVALHRLADWQLEKRMDPEAARSALHIIRERLPGTHLARMAELRINQLPTREELAARKESRPIPLPRHDPPISG
jgi:hypothetical protein